MTLTRFRLPLALTLMLFAVSCAHYTYKPQRTALTTTTVTSSDKCLSGLQRPEAPLVCVDDTQDRLSVAPDTARAFEIHPDKGPVTIVWFTASGGGNLRITPTSKGCMDTPRCTPNGHCRATILRLPEGKTEPVKCKYDVEIVGGRQPVLDPYVIVQTCCSP